MTRKHLPLAVALTAFASSCTPCADAFVLPDPSLERMLEQQRADDFERSDFFSDGKVLQAPPPGTVAYLSPKPGTRPPVTQALLDEGEREFNVTCAACHGRLGDGDSVVAEHMELVKPRDLHIPRLRAEPPAYFYDVSTNGYGLMRSYAAELDARERWAVAWYVKALQLSRHAPAAELPPRLRARLEAVP